MPAYEIDWGRLYDLWWETRRALDQLPDADAFLQLLIDYIAGLLDEYNVRCPSKHVIEKLIDVIKQIYIAENFSGKLPPLLPVERVCTIEAAQYYDKIIALHERFKEPQQVVTSLKETLGLLFCLFIRGLPHRNEEPTPLSTLIPVVDVIDVVKKIEDLTAPFLDDHVKEAGLFEAVRAQLIKNRLEVSRGRKEDDKVRLQVSARETVTAYLKGTPLLCLFQLNLPFTIPHAARFEHTHIVGGSGAGKTTLIQQIILNDLSQPDPPAMVIIDPKGLMVHRISRLDLFHPETGRLKDRLIIVDPTRSPPPALNMFHPGPTPRPKDYAHAQVQTQAISNFAYIFSSVGSKLTDKQSVPFTFLIRLLFTIPDATILTLLEILNDPSKNFENSQFAPFMERLEPVAQGFFRTEYYGPSFVNTRNEIKARLYSVLMRPELLAMFTTHERKLDLFDCLQNRKIVLINTAMGILGSEGSQLFGRYIIALTLNAAFERITVPPHQWNDAYLIIDEFQEFTDDKKTPEILRLAREYRLGLVIAHQQMHGDGMDDKIRNAVSTNTSIKYAAAVEALDLPYLARDLRTGPDFLQGQRRTDTHAHFACFVRNLTDTAVSISVPLGNIQSQPKMDENAYARLLARNAAEINSAAVTSPAPGAAPSTAEGALAQSTIKESVTTKPTDGGPNDPDSGSHTDEATSW